MLAVRAVVGGQAAARVGVDQVATRAVMQTRIALAFFQLGRKRREISIALCGNRAKV